MNHKKLRRLYAEEKLQVKRRGGRKRTLGTRRAISVVPHSCGGRRFNPRVTGAVPATSISGARVARELDTVIALRGRPRSVVSDNGTELTRWRSCAGPRSGASTGLHRTRQADPRMPSPRASLGACATSALRDALLFAAARPRCARRVAILTHAKAGSGQARNFGAVYVRPGSEAAGARHRVDHAAAACRNGLFPAAAIVRPARSNDPDDDNRAASPVHG